MVVDDETPQGHALRIAVDVLLGMGAGIEREFTSVPVSAASSLRRTRPASVCVLAGTPGSALAAAVIVCWRRRQRRPVRRPYRCTKSELDSARCVGTGQRPKGEKHAWQSSCQSGTIAPTTPGALAGKTPARPVRI